MPTLTWIGKDAVVNHHHEVPYHLLRDVPELGCYPNLGIIDLSLEGTLKSTCPL